MILTNLLFCNSYTCLPLGLPGGAVTVGILRMTESTSVSSSGSTCKPNSMSPDTLYDPPKEEKEVVHDLRIIHFMYKAWNRFLVASNIAICSHRFESNNPGE